MTVKILKEPLIKCHNRHCDREAQPWREAISNQVLSTCQKIASSCRPPHDVRGRSPRNDYLIRGSLIRNLINQPEMIAPVRSSLF